MERRDRCPRHHGAAHAALPFSFVGAALNPDRAVGYLAKGPFMEARVATGPSEALDGENVLPGLSLPLMELFGSVPEG